MLMTHAAEFAARLMVQGVAKNEGGAETRVEPLCILSLCQRGPLVRVCVELRSRLRLLRNCPLLAEL